MPFFSIRTPYAIHCSELLKFFVNYDRRFYEMAMLIKFWAKNRGLIHPKLISTYGLYLMVVFMLQNTSPPVLPTIERLQQLALQQPGKTAIKVHEYNFEFCDDVYMIGRSKNTQSTSELIAAFFRYLVNLYFFRST